jgi:formylglycine-generating enzyme required for sulfatase activity
LANPFGQYAWYRENNSPGGTKEVGLKLPNAWGLFDMSGNVWEWCEDGYDENYYSKSPEKDPVNNQSKEFKVLRGGSWNFIPRIVRSAIRLRLTPDNRGDGLGFRVARTLYR